MNLSGIKSDVEAHNKLNQILKDFGYSSEACAIVMTAYCNFVEYLLKAMEDEASKLQLGNFSENEDVSFRRRISLIGLLLSQLPQPETPVTGDLDWGCKASHLVFRCLYMDTKDSSQEFGTQFCSKFKVK